MILDIISNKCAVSAIRGISIYLIFSFFSIVTRNICQSRFISNQIKKILQKELAALKRSLFESHKPCLYRFLIKTGLKCTKMQVCIANKFIFLVYSRK